MEAFAGISGAATGQLDILVVTGDWYDVSVLCAGQHACRMRRFHRNDRRGRGARSSLAANMLVNNATIVDFGAFQRPTKRAARSIRT